MVKDSGLKDQTLVAFTKPRLGPQNKMAMAIFDPYNIQIHINDQCEDMSHP
jgi:hypothetical protein